MRWARGPLPYLRHEFWGIDEPPPNPDPLDDEFYGSSLDAKWTWLDQGGAAAHVNNSQLFLYVNEAANRFRGIYQTAPGGSFTIQAKLAITSDDGSTGAHLFVAENASGEVRTVSTWADTTRGIFFTTPSASGSAWGFDYSGKVIPVYFELAWDGTDLTPGFSIDGYSWLRTAPATLGYTPTLVGVGFTNSSGALKIFEYKWFRRVA